MPMAIVPLGVCVLPEPGKNGARTVNYPNYLFEILDHAGVFHTKLAEKELEARLDELRVLVTVGDFAFPPALRKKLADWINAGGAWLSIGGSCGMDDVLGATRLTSTFKNWGGGVRSLGEGYLVPEKNDHPMLAHINRPL